MTLSRTLILLAAIASMGCNHPLEIVGLGDILSASGERDCLQSDFEQGLANCTENTVVADYAETYTGVPHGGWEFHRWANYCPGAPGNECSFNIPGDVVQQFWGAAAPPLVAIFRPLQNTGLGSLFIGHSFFRPFAQGVAAHAATAGFADHAQSVVFAGGPNGAPQALWENASKRAEIQAHLDEGDVQLFGMTYHPEYPDIDGYLSWVDYALAQNPDTRFFIGLPWEPNPESTDAATYASNWETFHPVISHGLIDTLRDRYPGVDFFCIPYGESAVELRSLFSAGSLPDVQALVSGSLDSIYNDTLGHPDDILVELGGLVWLRGIYDVDLSTYPYDPGYQADLIGIAQSIMDGHDPVYDAPYH